MTINDVRDRLEHLRRITSDPEAAHVWEDRLMVDVLAAIADGNAEDPVEMARLALTSDDIAFSRWYA